MRGKNENQNDLEKMSLESKKHPLYKNCYFTERFPDIFLTQREIECLGFILKNHTNKKIGTLLNISHRTVELYVNHIKMKFKISRKSELMHLFK